MLNNIKFSKGKFKILILNLSILFPLILNNSLLSQIIIISFFCLSAIFFGNFSLTISKLLFLILIIFSIYFNFFQIEIKNALRLLQITLGFLVFPLAINSDTINIKFLRFGIAFVSICTLLDVFNVPFFFIFREYFYPIPFDVWGVGRDLSAVDLSKRFGSIFYNPNLLGQSMLLIFILYLLITFQKKLNRIDFIFLFSNVFCILISKSRTAFVIFGFVTFCYFFQFYKNKLKYLIVPIIIFFILYFLSGSRLLDIGNTAGGSMDQKWQILFSYLSGLSFSDTVAVLFGTLLQDIQFDNDLGNIIYYLGFIGLFYIVFFYLFESISAAFSVKYFYSFLLISYGATLLINFKFYIFTIIILSSLRSISKKINADRIQSEQSIY